MLCRHARLLLRPSSKSEFSTRSSTLWLLEKTFIWTYIIATLRSQADERAKRTARDRIMQYITVESEACVLDAMRLLEIGSDSDGDSD